MRLDRFAAYAWAVLLLNFAVVAWGAFVRASGSGAGCGSHWPLCNGQVVPRDVHTAMLIEFTHRVTSGLALVAVLVLLGWALARHAARHAARRAGAGAEGLRLALARPWSWELRGAALAMAFMLSEALVGAALVLLGLVAENDSATRAVVLGIHLVNTFFLLAFLALTAWWASGGRPVRLRHQGVLGPLLLAALAGLLLLGVTGAVTALGDTLFPSGSLREGFRQDFSPTAHFLLRLRVIHPALAVSLGVYLLLVASAVLRRRTDLDARRFARLLITLFFAQLAVGALNLLLRAPVWMQLVHLVLADAVWVTLVLLTATALADAPAVGPSRAAVARPASRRGAGEAAPANG
ncbi:MAG TPA: COX15/CtaA family protein [Gemmatimonadaceae bacterium]|nr:COX15/CtaA family protein [Gemmatimonadaceae bacterium]